MLGLAVPHLARGDASPPIFTGTQKVSVVATAAYGTIYSVRDFTVTLEITMAVSGPGQRTVTILDREFPDVYGCTLKGDVKGSRLVFSSAQKCALKIATPDFCLLDESRCSAHLNNRKCAQEVAAGHQGALTATVTAGAIDQDAKGNWSLAMNSRLDGCVLVEGYNHDAPIMVRGATITGRKP